MTIENLQVYLVGGAVRDRLLQQPVTEQDWVVVGSTPEELVARGFVPIGKDFPVFLHPKTHEEYALARTERKIAAGYRGFIFHTSCTVTLTEDLHRRDLTINAMAIDQQGNIIDPYHGQSDLQQKILRHVSSAFSEDPVRLLRIARFMARFVEFTIAPETQQLLQEMVQIGEIEALVPERVWQELLKALTTSQPLIFFAVLKQFGALEILFPALALHWTALNITALASPLLRFASLMLPLTAMQIQQFCQHYRVPKDYRQFALYAQQTQHYFQAKMITAAEILQLLNRVDVWRRPSYLNGLIQLFHDTLQQPLIEKAYQATTTSHTQQYIPSGLSGLAYGAALNVARLQCLTKIVENS